MGRFATECTASVPVGTVRMRDRAKRPRCGTWRRRSRTGGRQGGFKALVKSRSPASALRGAKRLLNLNQRKSHPHPATVHSSPRGETQLKLKLKLKDRRARQRCPKVQVTRKPAIR